MEKVNQTKRRFALNLMQEFIFEFETPSGSIGWIREAVLHADRVRNQWINPVEGFGAEGIWNGHQQWHVIFLVKMRKHGDMVGVRQSGGVPPLFDTPEAQDVRLPQIDGFAADQLAQRQRIELALPHRQ